MKSDRTVPIEEYKQEFDKGKFLQELSDLGYDVKFSSTARNDSGKGKDITQRCYVITAPFMDKPLKMAIHTFNSINNLEGIYFSGHKNERFYSTAQAMKYCGEIIVEELMDS